MIGYIVPVHPASFIGIIVSNKIKSDFIIYLNTSPKSIDEINIEFDSFNDLQFEKFIPESIQDLANKIALIKQGFDQDLSNILIDYSGYTEKQIQVIKTAMTIPINEIWPYSKVAEEALLPKAQRFVGTTMRVLRQPYIVPVHRVKSLSYISKLNRPKRFNKMPI